MSLPGAKAPKSECNWRRPDLLKHAIGCLVFGIVGYWAGRLFLRNPDLYPASVFPIAIFIFASCLFVGNTNWDEACECWHKRKTLPKRVFNTLKLEHFIFSVEEVVLALVVGIFVGLYFQVKNLGHPLSPNTWSILVVAAIVGFVWGARSDSFTCVQCNKHRPSGTIFAFKPLANPGAAIILDRCRAYAKRSATDLYEWISDPTNEGGVVVLNGPVGSGKSTFKNLILHALYEERSQELIIVEVSAWETLGEHETQKRLLSEIISGLDNHYALGRYRHSWSGMLESVGQNAPLLSSIVWMAGKISAEDYLSEWRQLFLSLRHHVVVVVEDLERFSPKELLGLLRLIDELRLFPNITFLIPTDKETCIPLLERGFGPEYPLDAGSLMHRTLGGKTLQVFTPTAEEFNDMLVLQLGAWGEAWAKEQDFGRVYKDDERRASDTAQYRWEKALANAARKLGTYRKLNLFSKEFSRAWSHLKGSVDFADLIYAEATRVIDLASFSQLFSPSSMGMQSLPAAYESDVYVYALAFDRKTRDKARADYFTKVLSDSKESIWVAEVIEEVFQYKFTVEGSRQVVRNVVDPSDDDKQKMRLRHPVIAQAFHQLSEDSSREYRLFAEYFTHLSSDAGGVEFVKQIRRLLNEFRSGKRAGLRDFDTDVFVRAYPLLVVAPEKVEILLGCLASEVDGLRSATGFEDRERAIFVRLMWLLVACFPANRFDSLFDLILSKINGIVFLPELHILLRFSDVSEIDQYMYGLMAKEKIEYLISKQGEFNLKFAAAFKQKMRDPEALNVISNNSNDNWVFGWFVSVSADKNAARIDNCNLVKYAIENGIDPFLNGLRHYLYIRKWPNEADRLKWATDTLGPEAPDLLEKIKIYKPRIS